MIKDRLASYQHFGVDHDFRTLDEYFGRIERTKSTVNIGTFVGSGGLRDYVMGSDDRPATPAELIELAKVAASYGGIYITHQRSEGNLLFESLDEVFAIAERANVHAEIWHLKAAYKANWGTMAEALRRIEAARARGVRVSANIYPYNRASNGLDACLPIWAREGGTEALLERLAAPAVRARIKKDMDDPGAPFENQWYGAGGGAGVMLSSVLNPELRRYEGMNLAEIGRAMGKDPRDAVMDLVVADRAESSVITAIMNDDDVRTKIRHPLVSFGTDSSAQAEDGPLSVSTSHPRGWGSFTRILGRFVRDEQLLTLEEAVRKATSQAAIRVGIRDRGLLRPGMFADIIVFDPATVRDESTLEDPRHYSTGMRHVFVNGRAVLRDGRITDQRPGRPVRGPGWRKRSS
jgi:N-acyl-D-aspartate/D-glutamate deacylase